MHKSVMHVQSWDSFLLSRLRLPPSSLICTICGPLINEPKLEQFVEQCRWTQIHKYVTTQWFQVTDKLARKFIRLLLKNGFVRFLHYYLCCLSLLRLPRPSRSTHLDERPTSFPGISLLVGETMSFFKAWLYAFVSFLDLTVYNVQ